MATGNSDSKMVRINIYITKQQESKLEELKTESGLPVAELLRRSIDFYVPFAHKLGITEVEADEQEG